MKNKRIIVIMLTSLLVLTASKSQDCDLKLMAIPAEQTEDVPTDIQEMLIQRLTDAIVTDGVTAGEDYAQFFVSAKISYLYKENLSGPPMVTAMTTRLNLYIGDNYEQKIFSTLSLELKGVGTNDSRAFINAFKGLNKNDLRIHDFVAKGKIKILDYFNRNYKNILERAKQSASVQKYDEALYYASSIPDCCKGYSEAANATIKYYKLYINYNCKLLVAQAKNIWAVNPDQKGAKKVMSLLNQINPNAACYNEAQALYKDVADKVKTDWTFENKKKYEDEMSIKKNEIEAAKAVGVAFGNGQKAKTTNIMWLK